MATPAWSVEATPHPIPAPCLVPASQNHTQCLSGQNLPLVDTRTNSEGGKAALDSSHGSSPHQQTQMGMGRAKVGAVSTFREYLGFVCQISAAAVGLVWPFSGSLQGFVPVRGGTV